MAEGITATNGVASTVGAACGALFDASDVERFMSIPGRTQVAHKKSRTAVC
ncbi:hypothetical protein D9M69_578960 [compost metagenome]